MTSYNGWYYPSDSAELTPDGGNVGTFDPYIQLISYSPKPDYPMLQPWGDESTQYINGQQVSVELDGMPISLSTARSMMESGEAISTDLVPQLGS